MTRYSSAALLLYLSAVLAQALTWGDLGAAERGTRVVVFLLVGAVLVAILDTRGDRDRGQDSPTK
ncbi:hypothetical protein G4H71_21270 [Rhodococcus triatomae]|uniref:Uncharacterized protein n=1 Tax=Rhodococcus triatomae TaxID=300028 RepID=A0A1G8K881_9NOCA|nr:hypothetical protein [Rhodococcus triatomae]QNG18849.1 hypothetical protein G4H72_09105 [Rhodococcus triatomae]QNG25238.1 hypothetical protein G4H71_21270 [Rhodococcus triatomae]SDI39634.1 hypothetical protein SAMN05444695_10753 [Rhodococcus triatomae]